MLHPVSPELAARCKKKNTNEPRDIVEVVLKAVKSLPCFSLQKSRDLKTDLVRSPGNEMIFSGSTNKWCLSGNGRNVEKSKHFICRLIFFSPTTSNGAVPGGSQ